MIGNGKPDETGRGHLRALAHRTLTVGLLLPLLLIGCVRQDRMVCCIVTEPPTEIPVAKPKGTRTAPTTEELETPPGEAISQVSASVTEPSQEIASDLPREAQASLGQARVSEPLGQARVSDPLGQARVSDPLGQARVSEPLGQARVSEPLGQAGLDELSILDPVADADPETWNCPILIHQSSEVLVAAPCEIETQQDDQSGVWTQPAEGSWSCPRFRSIALRKVSGQNTGSIRVAPVRRGQASFVQLTAGAYDVYYLTERATSDVTESALPRYPDRRILVEPEPITLTDLALAEEAEEARPIPSTLTWEAEPTELALPDLHPFLADIRKRQGGTSEQFVRARHPEADKGWDLLRKRSTFGAKQIFEKIILDELRAQSLPSSPDWESPLLMTLGCPLVDLLEGRESVAETLRRRRLHLAAARELADHAGGNVRLAEGLYGLAKCFDAIAQEPEPLVPGSAQFALALYAAAFHTDSAQTDALNDFGVLCFRLGWIGDAEQVLEVTAASIGSPAAAFNLSQVYARTGRVATSQRIVEATIRSDARCLPAVLSSIQQQVQADSTALYPVDYYRFAQRLGDVAHRHADWAVRQAAISMLQRLEPIGREIRLNRGSLHQWTITRQLDLVRSGSSGSAIMTANAMRNPGPIEPFPETGESIEIVELEELPPSQTQWPDLPSPPPAKVDL